MNKIVLENRIRSSRIIRTVLYPFMRMAKYVQYVKYKKSKDSKFIQTLKNTCNGERCFVIGNGPSLLPEDLTLLKEEKCFAFNRIYDMYQYTPWRPSYYMCMDNVLLRQFLPSDLIKCKESEIILVNRKKLVDKYRKLMNVKQMLIYGKIPVKKEQIVLTKVKENVDLCFSPCPSVAISAIELAIYMGFKEIYLLGFDHNFPYEIGKDGKKVENKVVSHFKETVDKVQYCSYKEALTESFETCRKYADSQGILIHNVTRGGKLEVFDREQLENVLYQID